MFGYILTLLSLCYIVFIYSLWLSKVNIYYKEYYEPVSIIIPCYNEGAKELIHCVESCILAKGEHETILVNNNSNKEETLFAIEYLRNKYSCLKIYTETKQGKRFAHCCGLSKSRHKIVVFVDSDTIISTDALIEIVKPFQDNNVGAVAGQIKLTNKKDNILTRSIDAMFWTSCNIFRKAGSSIGMMAVIAGALGAYRKELLLQLEHDYITQKFLGRSCSISDDRYLTMRIQTRCNKSIAYQETAIGFTTMPKSIISFWKTMERWKRGVLRESILIWKEPKNAKVLLFDVQFNFIISLAMLVIKIIMIYNLIVYFSWFSLFYTMGWFVLISMLYSTIMIVENTKDYFWKITWSLMYEFIFCFTLVHAIINIRKQGKWSTR